MQYSAVCGVRAVGSGAGAGPAASRLAIAGQSGLWPRRRLSGLSLVALASGLVLAALALSLVPIAARAADCTVDAATIAADCTQYANSATLGTLTNSATISAPADTYFDSVALTNTGTVTTLDNDGTISAVSAIDSGATGLDNQGQIGTLDNAGTIAADKGGFGNYANGIDNSGTISLIVNSGSITGEDSGILNTGSIGVIVNTGSINGDEDGIKSDGGTLESIENHGTITGELGVSTSSALTSLENSGTITGVGIGVQDGQSVETFVNTGAITAPEGFAFGAVAIACTSTSFTEACGTFGTISNSGTIEGGTLPGLTLLLVGTDADKAGSIDNFGTISGYTGVAAFALTLDAFDNAAGGTITGEQGGLAVTLSSIDTLTNDGTISGTGDASIFSEIASTAGVTLPDDIASLSGNAAIVAVLSDIGIVTNNGTLSSSADGFAAGLLGVGSTFETISNGADGTISSSGSLALGLGLAGGSADTLENEGMVDVTASGAGGTAIGLLVAGPAAFGVEGDATAIGTLSTGGTINATGDIALGGLLGLASVESFDTSGTLSAEGGTLGAGLLVLSSDVGAFSNSGTISGSGAYSGGMALVGLGAVGDNLEDSGIGELLGGSDNSILALIGGLDDTALETPAGIDSFDNSGTISGGLLGLYVASAEIGEIDNSGTISSGSVGLYLDGGASVGDIDNSGEITGPEAMAMYGDASFGSITNSGTIAGTIRNRTSSDLTFIGGSGDTFGLITGYSADPSVLVTGLIDSRAADVTFQSGNMRLNADIDVGSGLVSNAGTLRVDGAVTITGNYTQSAAGKLVIAATADEIGKLTVSGLADLTDSTIVIVPIGGYRFAGDVANILSAGSLDVTGLTLKAGTETISFDTDTVDDLTRLLATLPDTGPSSAYAEIGAAAGAAGGAMGAALDIIAGEGSDAAIDFQSTVLVALLGLDDVDQPAAIAQLAPSADTPDWQMGFTAGSLFTDAVAQRQVNRMGGTGAGPNPAGPSGYAASPAQPLAHVWDRVLADSAPSDLDAQIWAQALGGVTDGVGYGLAGGGVAFGADVAPSQDVLIGAAGSWLAMTAEPDLATGTGSTQQLYQGHVYGSWHPGAFYVDAQAGLGLSHTAQSRAITFLGDVAEASFNGHAVTLHAQAGYDLPLASGSQGELVLTPLAGFDFSRASYDGYTETGAGAANLTVDAQTVSSLTSSVGARLAWTMTTAMGRLTPELRAAWVREHITGPIVTTGTLAGTDFSVSSDRPAADGAELGLSLTLDSGALQFGADYSGQFRADQASHAFTLNGAVRF